MAGIQIKFSVPQFPEFRYGLNSADYLRYEQYMKQFMGYATSTVAAQVKVSNRCMEAGSFLSQKVEIENLVKDVRIGMDTIADRSAMGVEAEMQGVMEALKELKAGKVETVTVEREETDAVSDKTLRNRQWRQEKKERKAKRRGHISGVTASSLRLSAERKWEAENNVATKRAEQLANAEFDPEFVAGARAMSRADMAKKLAQDKAETARLNKLAAKYEKQLVDGTLDREIQAHHALLDGKISGKFALNASKRVVGFAETVTTGSSRSKKSLWSGSGATDRSTSLSSDSVPEQVFLRRANDLLQQRVDVLEKKLKDFMDSSDGYETPPEGRPGNY
jgi:ribonuclease HI